MKRIVLALVLLLLILHQDVWWWDRIDPIILGFMPIGLAFHVLLSILTAIVYWLAVKHWWPNDVDVADHEAAAPRKSGAEL